MPHSSQEALIILSSFFVGSVFVLAKVDSNNALLWSLIEALEQSILTLIVEAQTVDQCLIFQ